MNMFIKIGKKIPDHHLLFFSFVLIALSFLTVFNPIYSPIQNNEVEATGLPPVINILSPTSNLNYATSSAFITFTGSVSDPEGDSIDGGSTDLRNNTTGENLGNLVPYVGWSKTNTVDLDWGLNDFEFKVSADGDQTIVHLSVYRLPEEGGLYGYAWADTIGWVSMTSLNCDTDLNGYSDGIGDCPVSTTSIPGYAVKIDNATGNLSGYAWSPNIGWIDFASTSPAAPDYSFNSNCLDSCTVADACTACYAPNNDGSGGGRLYGWAKLVSLGDDGWISFGTTTSALYGVDYDVSTNQFSGFAWNGNEGFSEDIGIGWLSFSSLNCDTDDDGFSNGGGDCPSAGTSIAKYSVSSNLNMPPTVRFITTPGSVFELPCGQDLACSSDCEIDPIVHWEFDDPEGFNQVAYHFIFVNDDSAMELINESGNNATSQISVADYVFSITYNTNYTAYIETWDNYGLSSGQISISFKTPIHDYPQPSFDWFIKEGSAQEEILFWDTSTYFEDVTNASSSPVCPEGCSQAWSTTIAGTNIDPTNSATTTVIYPFEGTVDMTLEITDNVGTCETTRSDLKINKKLPQWIEVR